MSNNHVELELSLKISFSDRIMLWICATLQLWFMEFDADKMK